MNGLVQTNRVSGNGAQALVQQAKPESLAVPSTQTLTAKQQVVMDRVQSKAHIIRDIAFPAAMASAIPVAQDIGSAAFKLYLDGFIKEAGSPADPVEIMLLEQLSLAHHRVAQLHAQAERCKSVDEAKVYTMAAVRLTGEFRRLALALNQYRQPIPRRSFTLIKQQNLSRTGQQIAYVDRSNESQPQVPFDDDAAKLRSTATLRLGTNPDPDGSKTREEARLTLTDDRQINSQEHTS